MKGISKKINSEIVEAPDLVIAKSALTYFLKISLSKPNSSFSNLFSSYFFF